MFLTICVKCGAELMEETIDPFKGNPCWHSLTGGKLPPPTCDGRMFRATKEEKGAKDETSYTTKP